MSNRKLVVGVAVGVAVIGLGAYLGLFSKLFGPQSPEARREATLKQDRKNLQKKDASVGEVRAALLRLSSTQDPAVFEQSLGFIQDSSPEVRSAVAYAVGRYPGPKSNEALKKLMGDASPDVRRDAIRAAATLQDPARREMIDSVRHQKNATPGERIAFWEAILRWDPQSKEKGEAFSELNGFVKSADSMIRAQAVGVLVARMRDDSRVASLLKEQLEKGAQPSDRVMAMHHLVAMKDKWLIENFQKYLNDNASPDLQSAALQLTGSLCPKNRWEVLETRVMDAKAPIQIRMAAVHGIRSLGSSKGVELLRRALDSAKSGDPALADLIKRMIEQMGSSAQAPENCQ